MIDPSAIYAAVLETVRQSLADRLGVNFDGDPETGWRRVMSEMSEATFSVYRRDLAARIVTRLQLNDRDIVPRAMGLVASQHISFKSFVGTVATAIIADLDGDPDFGGTKPDGV